jgi:hypothetical protein
MNVVVCDRAGVRKLRCAAQAEHLAVETARDGRAALLLLYHTIAHENRRKSQAGRFDWRGVAFDLTPDARDK